MGYARVDVDDLAKLSAALSRGLGVRRSQRLFRIAKKTGMPPEALLDVAIELLECVVGRLSPYPANSKPLPGLASGRWRTCRRSCKTADYGKLAIIRVMESATLW